MGGSALEARVGCASFPEVVRMARRVRARCPNDVRAREETTSGAVVVLAKGDVTDRTGDEDFKKGKDVSLTPIKRNGING